MRVVGSGQQAKLIGRAEISGHTRTNGASARLQKFMFRPHAKAEKRKEYRTLDCTVHIHQGTLSFFLRL